MASVEAEARQEAADIFADLPQLKVGRVLWEAVRIGCCCLPAILLEASWVFHSDTQAVLNTPDVRNFLLTTDLMLSASIQSNEC